MQPTAAICRWSRDAHAWRDRRAWRLSVDLPCRGRPGLPAEWLWGRLRFVGSGQCRGELVEGLLGRIALAAVYRMAGEPGLVEQRRQPPCGPAADDAAAGGPRQPLVGRIRARPRRTSLGQAVLHRPVARGDGGA